MASSAGIYSKKSTIIQIGVSVIANIGYYLNGLVLGFPSALLPPLVESDTPGFHANVEEGSWIASLSHISCPLGCLLGGPLVDMFGRCRGLQILNIPNIIGWTLMALVPTPYQSIYPLMVGRLLTGFAAGLATCASATYIAEVVTIELRTLLVSLAPVMMGVGIFTIYLLAFLFQDQWMIAACFALVISVLSALLTPLLPESPLWLLGRNKSDAALKSLMTMRGTLSPQVVEKEFNEMKANASTKNAKCSWQTTIRNLGKPEAYKPLIIMNMFYFFQQLSGVTIIITYGVKFAQDAEIPNDAYIVALFIGVVRVFANFLTTWGCNLWGRRIPAISMSAAMSLSLFGLAGYLSLRHNFPDTIPGNVWIPAIFILTIILTSSIVFSTLLYSMLGEVFPTSVRGVCSGMSSCMGYIYSFIAVKFYPTVELHVGNIAVFLFFGMSALLGATFLAIFLPETHGKSLQDIEEYFRGSKKSEKEGYFNTKL